MPTDLPERKTDQTDADNLWYLTRWALGGIILIVLTLGSVLLSVGTFGVIAAAGHPWQALMASATVFCATQAGATWFKTKWILHVIPEVLKEHK